MRQHEKHRLFAPPRSVCGLRAPNGVSQRDAAHSASGGDRCPDGQRSHLLRLAAGR